MRKTIAAIALGATAIALAGCSSAPAPAPSESAELTHVNFGMMPYFDYAPWELADAQGFFAEEGIDYESTMFPVEGNLAPALVNGSIDVGAFSDTAAVQLAGQFSDLRMVGFQNVFTGFAIMSREGAFTTYDEFLDELGDPQEAASAIADELKGKSVVTTSGAAFEMVLDQALANGGLTMDDIDVIDFEPDAGVAAFESGTGDFFLGGLPQRQRLTELGSVALISGDQIGAGAIALSGIAASSEFADAHPEVLAALQRVWFKTMAYLQDHTQEAEQFIADWGNANNGASNTAEDVAYFYDNYVIFASTLQDAIDTFYTEGAPLNWKTRIDYLIDYNEATGVIEPGSVNADDLVIAQHVIEEVE